MLFSQECRKCQEFYSTSFPRFFKDTVIEPNSGIMFQRSNVRNIGTFHRWLQLNVEENIINDQRVFDRKKLRFNYVHQCISSTNSNTHNQKPSYCFLNEILFQNGLISISCPTKHTWRDDYVMEVYQYGVDVGDIGRYPVAVHVSYCNGKSKELERRGLWLIDDTKGGLNSTTCNRYDRSKTYYGTLDWESEASAIQQRRQESFDSVAKRNGTVLVKSISTAAVYYVDNRLERHIIANSSVFVSHFGENWGLITTVPFVVMMNMTLGKPLDVLASIEIRNPVK